MSGFDFNDGDGSSLAAIAYEGKLVLSSSFGDGDYDSTVIIELPKAKAVEFAQWILAQLPQQEGS